MSVTKRIPLILVLLPCVVQIATISALPCHLVWKQVDAGCPIGQDWVAFGEKDTEAGNYIVRVPTDDDYSVGIASSKFNKKRSINEASAARFSDWDGSSNILTYQVLTNPHRCSLSWGKCNFDAQVSDAYVKVSDYSEGYIGRIHNKKLTDLKSIPEVNKVSEWDDYEQKTECLSARAQMDVKFSQFQFEYSIDDKGGSDFVGTDLISNRAETNVTQRIEHRKLYGEIFEFTHQYSWEAYSSWTFGFSLNLFFVDISLTNTEAITVGAKSSYTKEFRREREIKSAREISVPPYTSVQACSTMDYNDGFTLKYTGQARHTGSGMTVDEIEAEVRKIGYKDYRREGNSVVVNLSGTLYGKLALKTAFYVTGTDDQSSCYNLGKKYRERNRLNRLGNATEEELLKLQKVEQEIVIMQNKMRKIG